MCKISKELIFSIVSMVVLLGCGNASSSSSSNLWYGKFVDTGVVNLDWSCGKASGKTGAGGVFGPCAVGSKASFKIGSYELGSVAETSDHIFTPHDLVGVKRDASKNSEDENAKVNAIVAFLLTTDSDGNKGNDIIINREDVPTIVKVITKNGGEITPDNINSVTAEIVQTNSDLTAVSIVEAATHIATTVTEIEEGKITSPNQDGGLTGGTTVEIP